MQKDSLILYNSPYERKELSYAISGILRLRFITSLPGGGSSGMREVRRGRGRRRIIQLLLLGTIVPKILMRPSTVVNTCSTPSGSFPSGGRFTTTLGTPANEDGGDDDVSDTKDDTYDDEGDHSRREPA